jgi:large subunit ribosomal protein L16
MLLFPEKTKYKKYHKGLKKLKRNESSITQPSLGFSGIKAFNSFKITSKQIDAIKKVLVRNIKRKFKYKTKLKMNLFPDIPMSKKSSGIRMGKGKGNVDHWCFLVKKGRILFEFDYKQIPLGIIYNSFKMAADKLPLKSLIIL